MSEETPKRVIKSVRLNNMPLLYGDKKLQGILAEKGNSSGNLLDIRAVEQKIEQILADAGQRAVQIEKEAYTQGFSKGVDEAIARAKAETDAMCRQTAEEAQRLIQSIQQERERVLLGIEPQVIDLVFKITRKIIRQELEAKGKEVVVVLVREALKQAANEESVKIKINPTDYQTIQDKREELVSETDNIGRVEIESDRAVLPGNCTLETSCGTIDAGIEAQIENIEEAFNELNLNNGADGSAKLPLTPS